MLATSLPRNLHTSGLTFILLPISHRPGSKVNLLIRGNRDELLFPGSHSAFVPKDQANQDREKVSKRCPTKIIIRNKDR